MDIKKLENILDLSAQERYLYFIRKVADSEKVWGLYDEGWALLADDDNNEVLPFWPESEFAQICAIDKWSNYKPKSIDIYSFVDKWLTGMRKDNKKAGVFYNPQGKGLIIEPEKLRNDLKEELKQYE
jgi:Protein of unknown function (DUF2750)